MFDFPKDVLILDISVVLVDWISGLVGVPLEALGRAAGHECSYQ